MYDTGLHRRTTGQRSSGSKKAKALCVLQSTLIRRPLWVNTHWSSASTHPPHKQPPPQPLAPPTPPSSKRNSPRVGYAAGPINAGLGGRSLGTKGADFSTSGAARTADAPLKTRATGTVARQKNPKASTKRSSSSSLRTLTRPATLRTPRAPTGRNILKTTPGLSGKACRTTTTHFLSSTGSMSGRRWLLPCGPCAGCRSTRVATSCWSHGT